MSIRRIILEHLPKRLSDLAETLLEAKSALSCGWSRKFVMADALTVTLLVITSISNFASGETENLTPPDQAIGRALEYKDAVVLGIVEGVTEFLPVSSTGHLIISNRYLGLDLDIPAMDAKGKQIWTSPPGEESKEGELLTIKDAADAYAIIIQVGAIAAVLILYWQRVWTVILGFLGRNKNGLLLGRNLIIAFIPAVVLGLTLEDIIDQYLFETWPVIAALFAGGLLMLGVEKWRESKPKSETELDLHDLSIKQSLCIGLLQCVAMWPGTSRSMMTIVGGYIVGLSAKRAAEFSFLLGLPTLTGAAFYKGMKVGPQIVEAFGWSPVLLGNFVAAISAAIAVKWMVNYLTKHGFALFAWYRIALAIGVSIAII